MDISALNNYFNNDLSSKKADSKNSDNAETDIAEAFKKQVLVWEEKNKEKIDEQQKNDNENNIKMSDKQWNALMYKVDSAIKAHKHDVKGNHAVKGNNVKAVSSKLNNPK